jgi:hypothetical protein
MTRSVRGTPIEAASGRPRMLWCIKAKTASNAAPAIIPATENAILAKSEFFLSQILALGFARTTAARTFSALSSKLMSPSGRAFLSISDLIASGRSADVGIEAPSTQQGQHQSLALESQLDFFSNIILLAPQTRPIASRKRSKPSRTDEDQHHIALAYRGVNSLLESLSTSYFVPTNEDVPLEQYLTQPIVHPPRGCGCVVAYLES